MVVGSAAPAPKRFRWARATLRLSGKMEVGRISGLEVTEEHFRYRSENCAARRGPTGQSGVVSLAVRRPAMVGPVHNFGVATCENEEIGIVR
jgi:hypothetical protein